MAMSRPITVVSGGEENFKKFVKVYPDLKDWYVIDLKEVLVKNPVDSVGHREDAQYALTQRVVMSQDGFNDLIMHLVRAATGEDPPATDKMFVKCWSGFHRADTVGMCLSHWLNALHDDKGDRLFNSMQFPLHNTKDKGFNKVIANIKQWIECPWMLQEAEGNTKQSTMGYNACRTSPEASNAWGQLYEEMHLTYHIGDPEMTRIKAKVVCIVIDVQNQEVATP